MNFLKLTTTPTLFGQLAGRASDGDEMVVYELGRLAQFDSPQELWVGVACVTALLIAIVVAVYRRESRRLSPLGCLLLVLLRTTALAALVFFFLQLQRRTDRKEVTESKVVMLVDVSRSMAIEDEVVGESQKVSRSDATRQFLSESGFVDELRAENDVDLVAFDVGDRPVATWSRGGAEQSTDDSQWQDEIAALGPETRIGDALAKALSEKHQAEGPLAAILVFSDGGQNQGIDPLSLTTLSARKGVPLHTIGVGSTEPRRNLRVQELIAPLRVYPADKTTVRGFIAGEGFRGRSVDVHLFAHDGAAQHSLGRQAVHFDSDNQVIPVEYEMEPTEVGRLTLELRIDAPADDQYPADNRRGTEVEVVAKATRVLLIADGATREYRFLRNQLYRDRYTSVDVWLQSAMPGVSQDADKILSHFPSTPEELYEYDCIVGFDPDWKRLDAEQVDLLEKWVADEAGGLLVIAGPVNTAGWVHSADHTKVRGLYPVEFQRRLKLLDDGSYGSPVPWPIDFSREGQEADFLWLADTPEESRLVWAQFTGVFGCYAVKGPKAGARVYGQYSDPDAGITVSRPVFLAEHFYGAGRVFYMGSGEMWRLRRLDPGYFEILYTQLIRHVSQGRLLRGSSHGHLLVERDRYTVGETVVVRAHLKTATREPLLVPSVTARLGIPGGEPRNLTLLPDAQRPGNYIGQFAVVKEGVHRVSLSIPHALEETLVRRIQVTVPNLEFGKTQRNEMLLASLATRTAGRYYGSLAQAQAGTKDLRPVAELIKSRAETVIRKGSPDREFSEWLSQVLLWTICGCLFCEWFLRRLLKLA